jgi:integrase/recombinase XerD
VFCTLRGAPVDDSYCRQMVKRMARRAGIEKRVHPHGLRHSFAVECVREGLSLPLIQQALGHSSLQTTAIYLAGLSPEESLAAVRAREWTP